MASTVQVVKVEIETNQRKTIHGKFLPGICNICRLFKNNDTYFELIRITDSKFLYHEPESGSTLKANNIMLEGSVIKARMQNHDVYVINGLPEYIAEHVQYVLTQFETPPLFLYNSDKTLVGSYKCSWASREVKCQLYGSESRSLELTRELPHGLLYAHDGKTIDLDVSDNTLTLYTNPQDYFQLLFHTPNDAKLIASWMRGTFNPASVVQTRRKAPNLHTPSTRDGGDDGADGGGGDDGADGGGGEGSGPLILDFSTPKTGDRKLRL